MRAPVAVALSIAAALAFAPDAAASKAKPQTITIGTAGVMGVYHPLGGAICRMLAATRSAHKLRCVVESSDGSVANIDGVLAGRFDLGFAQSDVQFHAMRGEPPFKDRPQPGLRALFSVYPELFTVVARRDANIATFEDLRGKRVAIGLPGSGTRATMELAMAAFGLRRADLRSAPELNFLELSPALCDNKIDAFVLVGGHPNAIVHDAAGSCEIRVAAVAGPPVDALTADRPYYVKAQVPGRMYKGNVAPQPSFGAVASVVVSADMPDDVAYAITRAVFDNFDDFTKLHPAVARLTKQRALEGASVPLHPGAVRYFRQAGLLP